MKLYLTAALALLCALPAFAQDTLQISSMAKYLEDNSDKVSTVLIDNLMKQGSRPAKETLTGKYRGTLTYSSNRTRGASFEIEKTKIGYTLNIWPKPQIRINRYFLIDRSSQPTNWLFRGDRSMESFNSITITQSGKYLLVKIISTSDMGMRSTSYGYFRKIQETASK